MKKRVQQKNTLLVAENGGASAFPLHDQLVVYCRRLIGKCRLTKEFLTFIFSLFGVMALQEMAERLLNKKYLSRGRYESDFWFDEPGDLAEEVYSQLVRGRLLGNRRKIEKYLAEMLNETGWKNIVERQEGFISCSHSQGMMNELARMFDLTEHQMRFIIFLFCKESHKPLNDLCETLKLNEYFSLISIATDIPVVQVIEMLSPRSKLILSDVVNEDKYSSSVNSYELNSHLSNYLFGINDVPLAEKFCKKDIGSVIPLSDFNVAEKTIKIMKGLLLSNKPCNILLYGETGTGKTEFARSLARECGKETYFVQHGDEGGVKAIHLGIRAAAGVVPAAEGVIVVDEADGFLNTLGNLFTFFPIKEDAADKGALNSLLDNSKSKIIWITNRTAQMEESLQRRFSYSLQFSRFTKKERTRIWMNLTEGDRFRFLTRDDIESLAAKYRVNAAGIASALDSAAAILPESAEKREFIETVEEILRRYQDLMDIEDSGMLNPLAPQYDSDALNLDCNPHDVVDAARGFAAYRQENRERDCANLNLLFHGRPGTGKTEFAKYLAREAGMELIVKRASDLLSCWVGETEKRIKDAFEEAERERAMLFIDEADSFFYARERARHSWEVTFTNEFLTRMENHKGILICR
ncbi:MAG: ATP-binding protein, partial [Deltaproteobacteria bacterium]|nr:ATP-binding protein [Deltaproteobacteria bacterium]